MLYFIAFLIILMHVILLHKSCKTTMREYRTLKEKKHIINMAYSMLNNVKVTAWRCNIQPFPIHCWRATIISQEAAAAMVNQKLTKEEIRLLSRKKTNHRGSMGTVSMPHQLHLLDFYHIQRGKGHIANVTMIMVELCHVDASYILLPFDLLRLRVRRFCLCNRIVRCRTTHVAQNHVYNQDIMKDWVTYIGREITCNQYLSDFIVYLDESNVDYGMSLPYTLEDKGAEMVNAKNTGLSERAAAILAVTARGRKFPPLVIFKSVPGP